MAQFKTGVCLSPLTTVHIYSKRRSHKCRDFNSPLRSVCRIENPVQIWGSTAQQAVVSIINTLNNNT